MIEIISAWQKIKEHAEAYAQAQVTFNDGMLLLAFLFLGLQILTLKNMIYLVDGKRNKCAQLHILKSNLTDSIFFQNKRPNFGLPTQLSKVNSVFKHAIKSPISTLSLLLLQNPNLIAQYGCYQKEDAVAKG